MDHDQIDHERRGFTRIVFNGIVTITGQGGQWTGALLNLSLKGVLIKRPESWTGNIGDDFQVAIALADGGITLHMDAVTAHVDSEHVGFCCTHIDLDSITHLRRIMEFNLGDEDRITHEISSLLLSLCDSQMSNHSPKKKS